MMRPFNDHQAWWLISVSILLSAIIFFSLLSCGNENIGLEQKTGGDQKPSTNSNLSNTTPTLPPPPPVTPTPPPNEQTPAKPAPPGPGDANADSTALITAQASKLSLTIEDLGTGWVRGSAAAAPVRQAVSYSHVYYSQGSAFPPVIQNTVAVYRTIEAAGDAYDKERAENQATAFPEIGNECFLNNSVPRDQRLVFRKNNVVVWIWMQQYPSGDIVSYAKIVEKRIADSLIPSIPVPASASTSQKQGEQSITPVRPPAGGTAAGLALITKQAYEMVLTLEDMGAGWNKGNASPPAKQQASSTCHVYYSRGSAFAAGVQNTTAVYRTVDAAKAAYDKEKAASKISAQPQIGDECFLNDTLPLDKRLVFRKNNVVVWIWVQQFAQGDIEGYARMVEKKIIP